MAFAALGLGAAVSEKQFEAFAAARISTNLNAGQSFSWCFKFDYLGSRH